MARGSCTMTVEEFNRISVASGMRRYALAEYLGSRPETVSRYTNGRLPIPGPVVRLMEMLDESMRKKVNPTFTTHDKEYTPAESEFILAVDKFKSRTGTKFPSQTDLLSVLLSLGYERRPDCPVQKERPCVVCEKVFRPLSNTGTTCSTKCRQVLRDRKHKEWLRKDKERKNGNTDGDPATVPFRLDQAC